VRGEDHGRGGDVHDHWSAIATGTWYLHEALSLLFAAVLVDSARVVDTLFASACTRALCAVSLPVDLTVFVSDVLVDTLLLALGVLDALSGYWILHFTGIARAQVTGAVNLAASGWKVIAGQLVFACDVTSAVVRARLCNGSGGWYKSGGGHDLSNG